MTQSAIVDLLNERILVRLEEAASALREKYPRIRITTYSVPIGSRTEYRGHDVGVECSNPAVAADEADSVALVIGVKHLTTRPLLCAAAVSWGANGPPTGVDLVPAPTPWTDQTLVALEARLPELVRALDAEVARLARLSR